MGRIRRFDDAYSDPELVAAKYRLGFNAFFEVELAIADRIELLRGGRSSSPDPQSNPDGIMLLSGADGGIINNNPDLPIVL